MNHGEVPLSGRALPSELLRRRKFANIFVEHGYSPSAQDRSPQVLHGATERPYNLRTSANYMSPSGSGPWDGGMRKRDT